MKILIMNTGWCKTSTGKIAFGLYKKLIEEGHECRLLYGESDKKSEDKNVTALDTHLEIELHRKINQITGFHATFAPNAMRRFKKIADEFRPDLIQLYNIHGYYIDIYRMFSYISKKKIPIVYSMLDEHPYLGYCCYAYECEQFKTGCNNCKERVREGYLQSWYFNRARETFLLKKKAYEENDITFTGPEWVVKRASQSELLRNADVREVDEYVENKNVFIPRDKSIVRKKIGVGENKRIILNVAPFSNGRKGVKDFLELASRCKEENTIFINVGYDGVRKNIPSNFIGIPFVTDQIQLAEFYSAADLLICTSYADTMPNVCLEALSCGTPVCTYNITGNPYVAELPCNYIVEPGNVNELLSIVEKLGKKEKTLEIKCREYAVRRYSIETYYNKMTEIYMEKIRR